MKKLTVILCLVFCSLGAWAQTTDAVNIPFDKDNFYFNAIGFQRMDKIIEDLRENRTWTVAIYGHAHHREGSNSPWQQQKLSERRADIIKRYFLSHYIPIGRIHEVTGWGTTRSLNPAVPHANWRGEIYVNKNP